jgi:hypothetical protein
VIPCRRYHGINCWRASRLSLCTFWGDLVFPECEPWRPFCLLRGIEP